ncbi:unnamed protein product, partial [Rotaria sp. Silwood1]
RDAILFSELARRFRDRKLSSCLLLDDKSLDFNGIGGVVFNRHSLFLIEIGTGSDVSFSSGVTICMANGESIDDGELFVDGICLADLFESSSVAPYVLLIVRFCVISSK